MLNSKTLDKVFKSFAIVAMVIAVMIWTKDIVLPISFAALFSIVLLPIARRIENKTGRIFSIVITLLCAILVIALFSWFVVNQLTSLVGSLPDLENKFFTEINVISSFLSENFNISTEEQDQLLKEAIKNLTDNVADLLVSTSYLAYFFIQVPIYIFLFLFYRDRKWNIYLLL